MFDYIFIEYKKMSKVFNSIYKKQKNKLYCVFCVLWVLTFIFFVISFFYDSKLFCLRGHWIRLFDSAFLLFAIISIIFICYLKKLKWKYTDYFIRRNIRRNRYIKNKLEEKYNFLKYYDLLTICEERLEWKRKKINGLFIFIGWIVTLIIPLIVYVLKLKMEVMISKNVNLPSKVNEAKLYIITSCFDLKIISMVFVSIVVFRITVEYIFDDILFSSLISFKEELEVMKGLDSSDNYL